MRDTVHMPPSPADIIPGDWPLWGTARPALARPLPGGLTNRSFLLEAGGERLVLRRNSPLSAALDLNRSAEEQALRLADRAGLCAPLVYCDPGHQYLVTRYLGGDQWDAANEGALQQLAQLLRDIHRLPTVDAELDIDEKISRYWLSVALDSRFLQPLRSLERELRPHIATAQSLNSGKVLCHNDLLAENLVVTGARLYAIDWEYAATGDPFYDLAVISEGLGLSGDRQQLLLSAYLQRAAAESDRQRLYHWQVIYGYLSALWYAVQFSSGALVDPDIERALIARIDSLCERAGRFRG